MSRRDRYRLELERDDDATVTSVVLSVVDADGGERALRVAGTRLAYVVEPLRQIVTAAGVNGRRWSASRPLDLPARTGEQAELLLGAVRPLRRADRIAEVAEGVASMGSEEAAYWHAKATRRGGLHALRVLLTEGGR